MLLLWPWTTERTEGKSVKQFPVDGGIEICTEYMKMKI